MESVEHPYAERQRRGRWLVLLPLVAALGVCATGLYWATTQMGMPEDMEARMRRAESGVSAQEQPGSFGAPIEVREKKTESTEPGDDE